MSKRDEKLLIYGAGVIGSLYAVRFAEAGYDVSVYARGQRLEFLQRNGLLYRKDGNIHRAGVHVLSEVPEREHYEFLFLTVRENQLHNALRELRRQVSPTIVTMVNTLEPYAALEQYCGAGRILPAFPGAGGGLESGVLNAGLTPWLIQPTTFGEVSGKNTERAKRLAALFRKSGIPCQRVKSMEDWQLSHLGMVVPLADAYYYTGHGADCMLCYEGECRKQVHRDPEIMRKTAEDIRRNFLWLAGKKRLSPGKFYLVLPVPCGLLSRILSLVYASRFGDRFMYRHAAKAPDEMAELHRNFYDYVKRHP